MSIEPLMSEKEEIQRLFAEAESAYENEDLDLAIELFQRLAEDGHPEACRNLGFIYEIGDGVDVNTKASTLWYSRYLMALRRQAELGEANAEFTLGKLYQYGDTVSIDCDKALHYFNKSADHEFANATFHLAMIYRYGWCGVDQDETKFLHWLNRACELLHPEALYTKGLTLLSDDAKQGESYIRKSASLGFWPAIEHEENTCLGSE